MSLWRIGDRQFKSKNIFPFEKGEPCLWRVVIKIIYGLFFTRDFLTHKKWKGKFSLWKDIAKAARFFWDNIKFKVGRGDKVFFWSDC